MSFSRRALLIIAILAMASGPRMLSAQWTMTAPKLLIRPPSNIVVGGGAIVHKAGIIWAGFNEIFLSKDEGQTWEKRVTPLFPTDAVRNMDFLDDSIGLIASEQGFVYLTLDQAKSWTRLLKTSGAFDARFLGSASNIIVAQGFGGSLYMSSDQGKTWTSKTFGTFAPFIVPIKGGSAYALIGTGRLGAQIFSTTDYGATWTPTPDSVGYDSYMFGIDACAPERIYVANEDAGGGPQNGASEIFVSGDNGMTWRTTYTGPLRDLVGSISVSSNAIYAQRMSAGILRSTDFGNTWQDIGGPNASFDTRLVCAVTDNLVLAADREGNIWRTTNAGGDSVHGEVRINEITSTPDALFGEDTLYSCQTPTFDTLYINALFCVAPKLVRAVIEGDHPQDFTLLSAVPPVLGGADTLAFSFMPRGNGERRANLRLVLEDSTQIVVPMRGFGKGLTELLTTTQSAATDTLGATVYLPIRYESAGEMTGVAMQISYTNDQIEFVDAYDLNGVSVASATHDPRRHQLYFAEGNTVNGVIGHAAFRVYSGPDACMPVMFDSIVTISSRPPCAFAINPTMQAEICIPNDCVARHVSDYMRYGVLPKVTVAMLEREVLITSEKNLGDVSVRVMNALGVVSAEHSAELRSDRPLHISLPSQASGIYFVEVRSQYGVRVAKVVVE